MQEKKIKMEVTEREADMLHLMRDYVRSYPNGHPQLLEAAQRLFDDLVEPFSVYLD